MMALASCISMKIKNPFNGSEYSKDQLGVFVVFFDIFTVLAILIFSKTLMSAQ